MKYKRAKNKPQMTAETPSHEEFLIVGIGASAGGVQALKDFFENVAADSGMAYVVILHLSPHHDSRLAEVLQTVTPIPVTQVTKRVTVEPNHVYVVPPNEHLTMVDGDILVSPTISTEERRAPVDIFFRTLAESHQSRAVAVVLSGTGANGSMGLKRVKERGGVCFVQNPREAEFSEMPRNAIATELVDRILNVAEIPAQIAAYKRSLGKVEIPVEAQARPENQQQALREIFTQLRLRTGHDFSNYKRATVLRRIERRINVRHLPDLPSYANFVRENAEETNALLKDLLISVTNFFRDKAAFDFLELEILPKIFADKTAENQVRIWVTGCATGEEAYSLAMLCAERTFGTIDAPEVQIFATDIDEQAIAAARDGFYTLNDAADVSPERLRRFFTKEADGYRIRRELREMILFANHNVLKDPPFSRLDLITCRNLMIYLNQTAQERMMETFHFALNAGGFLFLGNSETVDGAGDLYAAVSHENHVYQSRQISSRIAYPVGETTPRSFRFDQFYPPRRESESERESRTGEKLFSAPELHLRLLEQFTPSVVVNADYDIIHSSESAARFFQIKGGEPTRNLLKLIRAEIRVELRTALYQAVERKTNVEIKNLKINTGFLDENINIYLRPVFEADSKNTNSGFILILFETAQTGDDAESAIYTAAEPMTGQLEAELIRSKSYLRSAVEKYEVQAEELKASNEELQAMNEEMRSATEELETSKEELQSVNEELVTVNQELKVKIEELSQSNNDFQNLINSTDIATIFLDRSFRVNSFTPAAARIFNLIAADYGRPLSDITHRLKYKNLLVDAEKVLETLQTIERETNTVDGRTFVMQILPYRTNEDRINGVVVTFTDITTRVQAEASVRESEEKYRTLFETIDEGFAIYELKRDENRNVVDMIYRETNKSYERLTGLKNVVGRLASELVPNLEPSWFERNQRVADTGIAERFEDYIADLDRWFTAHLSCVGGAGSNVIIAVFDDITERKQRERQQEFLLKFSDALRAEEGADDVANRALRMLFEELSLDRCYIGVYRLEDDRADLTHQVGNERVPPLPDSIRLSDFPAAFQVVFDRTLVIEDFAESEGLSDTDRQNIAALGLRALVAPCLRKGENNPLWSIVAVSSRPRRWTKGEIALIEEVTERTWAAIERARAEATLRASEEKYRTLFDSIDEGYLLCEVIFDENEKPVDVFYLEANPAAIRLAGRDFTGRRMREIDPDYEEYWYEIMGRVALTGESLRAEHYAQPHGRWFEFYASRVGGENSRRVASVFQDVTERRQAEEALRESEERLWALIKNLPGGAVFVFDKNLRYLIAEGEALENVGYLFKDLVGRTIFESLPTDLAAIYEFYLRQAFAGDAFEHEHQSHNHYYLSRGVPLRSANGEIYAVLVVSYDITSRKKAEEFLRQSEERLKLLIESAEDHAIFTMTRDGLIDSWNAGAQKIFGWTEDEILGQPSGIIFTPEDRAKNAPEKEIKTALRKGRAPDERFHLRKDGSRFFASGVLTTLKDANNKVLGFVKIARDMTEQIKTEIALRDKEMLQKVVGSLEEERRRIARDLHDELGQQLTALRLKLDKARKMCEDQEVCAEIDQIGLIAKTIDEGVDFLAWELRPAALDHLGLIPAVAHYISQWQLHAGVRAELLATSLKKKRLAREVETNLYRIVQEALNNVHKHAEANNVEIMLEKRGEVIVLIIQDDGKGFNVNDKKTRGKGIGLIGMEERAALIQGTLEIESAPGNGTTVFVRVPASAARKGVSNEE